jgi:hypothetical protein
LQKIHTRRKAVFLAGTVRAEKKPRKYLENWHASVIEILMKMRITIIGSLALLVLLEVGCSTRDLAYEKSRLRNPNRTAAVTTYQTDPNLPAVAAPPTGTGDLSWGGAISTR